MAACAGRLRPTRDMPPDRGCGRAESPEEACEQWDGPDEVLGVRIHHLPQDERHAAVLAGSAHPGSAEPLLLEVAERCLDALPSVGPALRDLVAEPKLSSPPRGEELPLDRRHAWRLEYLVTMTGDVGARRSAPQHDVARWLTGAPEPIDDWDRLVAGARSQLTRRADDTARRGGQRRPRSDADG